MNKKISPLLETDPESIGGWKLIGRLGQGGYGTIFLASKDKVNVALKMISKEWLSDIDAVGQLHFGNEARILKELDHPNIAKIIDQNLKTNMPFIAIEYLEGQTLERKIEDFGPLSEQEWFEYSKLLLSAIEYCHSKSIIHKDISPANIIITDSGPKLIDFGNSFLQGSARLTQEGVVNGTPGFMSPEHYEGNDLSPEMDLFSIACVLAYAGTGKPAFTAQTKQEYRNRTKYEAPDLSGLTSNQIEILTPLFYKNPKNRPSINEILKATDQLLQDQRLNSYENYLKDFSKKIVASPTRNDLPKKKLKILTQILVLALIMPVGLILLLQSFGDSKNFSPALSDAQLIDLSVCKDFALIGENESAIVRCRELAELGNASAQHSLGVSLQKLGDLEEAKLWLAKAANQQLPEALIAMSYIEIEQKNYSQALVWAQKSADLGELDGINAVGISYGYLKQYDSAVEWYKKSWELGDVLGAMNLGYHYRFDDYNKDEAGKWLKIAAENTSELFKGDTAFEYAEFLRIEIKNKSESCEWYKKSADAKYKEDDKDGIKAFEKFCSEKQVLPNPIKTALLSSDKLTVSPPIDSNVKISSIFGRVFKDSEMVWKIILSNSSSQPVPPINGIEVRIVGYEDAGWFGLPYKLKKDPQFDSVYAAVDDLFLSVLFKRSVCPEFRAVREENGKLVNIWTKGLPECSNDYLP